MNYWTWIELVGSIFALLLVWPTEYFRRHQFWDIDWITTPRWLLFVGSISFSLVYFFADSASEWVRIAIAGLALGQFLIAFAWRLARESAERFLSLWTFVTGLILFATGSILHARSQSAFTFLDDYASRFFIVLGTSLAITPGLAMAITQMRRHTMSRKPKISGR